MTVTGSFDTGECLREEEVLPATDGWFVYAVDDGVNESLDDNARLEEKHLKLDKRYVGRVYVYPYLVYGL